MLRKSMSLCLASLSLVVFLAGCAKEPESTATNTDPKPADKSAEQKAPDAGATKMAAVDFAKDVKPMLDNYCMPCHAGPEPKGGIDVSKMVTNDDAKGMTANFAKMAKEVEAGKMPPPKGKPLPDADRATLVEKLKALSS